MKIVTISGASKDVGKTNLAVSIIERYKGVAAVKYSLDYEGNGLGIVTDPEVLAQPGTDTGRFLRAGANPVFWVRTNKERLGLDLKKALSLLGPDSRVVIEGNSVLKHLKPALAVFVMNSSWEKMKPSALDVIGRVQIVVEWGNDGGVREKIAEFNPDARVLTFNPIKPDGKDLELLFNHLGSVWRD